VTKPSILFLGLGLSAFIVYVYTLAPTITWRNAGVDSGDLAAAVAVGGVPHPPGYPTYLVLAEGFKRLPFGDPAYRLNLLSATSAALAVAVMGLVISQTLSALSQAQAPPKETGQRARLIWLCAVSASLSLAFAKVFWSQAVITEVYALNALFAAVLFYGALNVRAANQSWLVPLLAGLLGLSLGNHPTILLLLPLLIGSLKARWRWRLGVATLLAFCVGLSIYVVIPLRAATTPPVNWGMATTWSNFWWLVSAEAYQPLLFSLSWKDVPARIGAELHLVAGTFMGWGLPLGWLGWQRLSGCNRSLAYSSLVTFLLISIYAIGYNTSDSYVYLLPALLIFCWWIGWGLYDFGRILQRFIASSSRQKDWVGWGMILLPFLSLSLNFSGQNLSQDDEAYSYARQSLQWVSQGAIIMSDDDPRTFALWYGRYGLALRPDVAVVNPNLLPYAWYRQVLSQTHAGLRLSDEAGRPVTALPSFVKLNLPNSPIYLVTPPYSALETYRLESAAQLQRVLVSTPLNWPH
jgi:hypothetical protein